MRKIHDNAMNFLSVKLTRPCATGNVGVINRENRLKSHSVDESQRATLIHMEHVAMRISGNDTHSSAQAQCVINTIIL